MVQAERKSLALVGIAALGFAAGLAVITTAPAMLGQTARTRSQGAASDPCILAARITLP
jgi:hypothetical protein